MVGVLATGSGAARIRVHRRRQALGRRPVVDSVIGRIRHSKLDPSRRSGEDRRIVTRLGRAARRVLPLVCLPSAAWGQRVSSSLDIGGAAMRYADSVNANGGALSPALSIEWPRGTIGGAATFSHFPSGWSSQGAMNASVFSRATGR